MNGRNLEITHSGGKLSITYDGSAMVTDLGLGIPRSGQWLWSFDGTLPLAESVQEEGGDQHGEYTALYLTYADRQGPIVRQSLRSYAHDTYIVVETTALRDLTGLAVSDSFFHTTFNSPVVTLQNDLRFLTYTWGLEGSEGVEIGGYFPDAAIAPNIASLPKQLRLAGFSPVQDIHQTVEKPFAPLVAYDGQERTLVMSPLDNYLISPMRLIDTPAGFGVARGLHGAVDFLPAGASTQTLLAFGDGLVPTMLKWGRLILERSGKQADVGRDHTIVKKLGFWNCYGSYYAELFRQTNAETLKELADYFKNAEIPVGYVGLDLWYSFDRVGFARGYQPDPEKYPEGLKAVVEETGLPVLLHMSAFDPETSYLGSYEFVMEEGSAYPARPDFYQDRAREFRQWGALGIWPDFLRTQLQHSPSLRDRVGAADRWFDGLCHSMSQQGLDVMLCMPTIGHYLASAAHANVIAVRTSTDYVNHQPGQLEILRRTIDEYRIPNTAEKNLRQNLLLSLLAGSLGLAPSYDVFITNRDHPEGFAEPEAERQALARALSAGIVGIGDKVGCVDRDVVEKLAFPDGTLSQPDHPLYPVASTLQSNVPVFYTTTTIGDFCWTYLAWFNLSGDQQEYIVNLEEFLPGPEAMAYDYAAGTFLKGLIVEGSFGTGDFRYLVLPPPVEGIFPLGFLDKYVPVSGRQVKRIAATAEGIQIDFELPAGRSYTFAIAGGENIQTEGRGISEVVSRVDSGQTFITFRVDAPECRLTLKRIH